MASTPPKPGSSGKPAQPDPQGHVIAEYRHRDNLVICTCGWQGSSAPRSISPRPNDSDWSDHRAAMRSPEEQARRR